MWDVYNDNFAMCIYAKAADKREFVKPPLHNNPNPINRRNTTVFQPILTIPQPKMK